MKDEKYGIDIEFAHERAIELIPEEFFWSCIDELAPFGSDEGDTALDEFRAWRREHPDTPTIECLKWVIESVGEMGFADYNETLADPATVEEAIEDEDFDDHQFIFTLDISVIATGFAQLVDEGIIEEENKPLIRIAINRQRVWAQALTDWDPSGEYLGNLDVLERALEHA